MAITLRRLQEENFRENGRQFGMFIYDKAVIWRIRDEDGRWNEYYEMSGKLPTIDLSPPMTDSQYDGHFLSGGNQRRIILHWNNEWDDTAYTIGHGNTVSLVLMKCKYTAWKANLGSVVESISLGTIKVRSQPEEVIQARTLDGELHYLNKNQGDEVAPDPPIGLLS